MNVAQRRLAKLHCRPHFVHIAHCVRPPPSPNNRHTQTHTPSTPTTSTHSPPIHSHPAVSSPHRADALGFLELLAEWRPDLVAAAFLAPALHHFGDLLSKGSRGRSLSAGSLAALHRVVAALERFLSRIAPERPPAPGAATASAGSPAQHGTQGLAAAAAGSHGEDDARRVPLRRARCAWPPLAAGAPAGAALLTALPASAGAALGPQAASRGGSAGGPAGDAAGDAAEEAARGALRHLLDCWSDCGPAQLATAPELALAQCLVCTLRSCDHLLRRFGPGLAGSPSDRASLAHALVKKVAPVFPMHAPAVPPSAAVGEALVQLNVAAAQLLARWVGAGAGQSHRKADKRACMCARSRVCAHPGVQGRLWLHAWLGWYGSVHGTLSYEQC